QSANVRLRPPNRQASPRRRGQRRIAKARQGVALELDLTGGTGKTRKLVRVLGRFGPERALGVSVARSFWRGDRLLESAPREFLAGPHPPASPKRVFPTPFLPRPPRNKFPTPDP